MKYYHGSPNRGIEKFHLDTEERYESVEGRGLYITDNYKVARSYAGSEGSVYELDLKNQAIFDACSKEEFQYCLERLSQKINFNLLSLEYLDSTLDGLVDGSYRISQSSDSGFAWQIRNLLDCNDYFMETMSDKAEDIYTEIADFIKDYLQQHSILKYNDRQLGLVYLSSAPEKIKIIQEIVIGSDEDVSNL